MLLKVTQAVAFSLSFALIGTCTGLYHRLGGDFAGSPDDFARQASDAARAIVDRAFADVEPGGPWDFHVHLLGTGAGGTGAYINARMESLWHPFEYLRTQVYKSAAGVLEKENVDAAYVARLESLIAATPGGGRYLLMALDQHYLADGTAHPAETSFYVPNAYVAQVAAAHPRRFVPMISVHPYRKDALQELRYWGERGVRFVKWLPNAMGMDPADPRIDPFYRVMAEYGMVLLTHAGDEQAVDADDRQALGNPLRLRRPLDLGVRVILAHCASLGEGVDLDSPDKGRVPNFELFLRLMAEPRYEGLLYGELSALVLRNRFDGPLQTLLARSDLHHRLVNGSDYPLPAVNLLVATGALADAGLIADDDREALNEVYRYNPLLFDYVLKRTLRHPETGVRFPPRVFGWPFDFPPPATIPIQ